jgi:hypothetical protein
MKKNVRILCSGVALGVYIPGIAIAKQLREAGVRAGVDVIENLLKKDKRDNIGANKKAFHGNFRFALMGQKMLSGDLWPHFDPDAMHELFGSWKRTRVDGFIILSGFWMSVMRAYLALPEIEKPAVEILHIDSDFSPSWNSFKQESLHDHHQWWINWNDQRLTCELLYDEAPSIPHHDRASRFVIHGGGWGMGIYQAVIPELVKAGKKLDIIVHEPDEATHEPGNRYYMVDPEWSPWRKTETGEHEYPPFAELIQGKTPAFRHEQDQHGVYGLVKQSRGVISKPGGSTLSDSLSSRTPVILLAPFGDHEKKNADLWESLGFGIRYEKWKAVDFDERMLEELHANLDRTHPHLPRYASQYLERG